MYGTVRVLLKDNKVIRSFEWHITVVLNPDGYHYTWQEEDCEVKFLCRLQRKNR